MIAWGGMGSVLEQKMDKMVDGLNKRYISQFNFHCAFTYSGCLLEYRMM